MYNLRKIKQATSIPPPPDLILYPECQAATISIHMAGNKKFII